MELFKDDKIGIYQSAQDIFCEWNAFGEKDGEYMENRLLEWLKDSKWSDFQVVRGSEKPKGGKYFKMIWDPFDRIVLSPGPPYN